MTRLRLLLTLGAAIALFVAVPGAAQEPPGREGGGPEPGNQAFNPHLFTIGFDTLGPPSTAYNTEVDIDAGRRFVYVGSLEFEPLLGHAPEGDPSVKAVGIVDPARRRWRPRSDSSESG